jgi:hypothetical protein
MSSQKDMLKDIALKSSSILERIYEYIKWGLNELKASDSDISIIIGAYEKLRKDLDENNCWNKNPRIVAALFIHVFYQHKIGWIYLGRMYEFVGNNPRKYEYFIDKIAKCMGKKYSWPNRRIKFDYQ